MLDRLNFLLGEALIALRRNPLMTFAAVSTVAVSLFLLGGLGYIYYRLTGTAEYFEKRFELRVYLKDGVTTTQVQQTARSLRAISGVSTAVWLPADKMWERQRQLNPNTPDVPNPYPEAFRVTIKNLRDTDRVIRDIRQIPTVGAEPSDIGYMADEIRFYEGLLRAVRWVGLTLGGLLFVTAGLLIYNAIRLTILSRRLEIRIMRLVGASHLTVYAPFMIEGIVQGILGGAVATGLLALADYAVRTGIESQIGRVITQGGETWVPPSLPFGLVFVVLASCGALYGLLCSSLAMRTPLRFR